MIWQLKVVKTKAFRLDSLKTLFKMIHKIIKLINKNKVMQSVELELLRNQRWILKATKQASMSSFKTMIMKTMSQLYVRAKADLFVKLTTMKVPKQINSKISPTINLLIMTQN